MYPFRCLLLLLFLVAVPPTRAQGDADVCTIGVGISPDIRGVQLGMQLEEVKRQFPNSLGFNLAPKPDEAGVIDAVSLNLLDWHAKAEAFKGVSRMSLVFTDGKVTALGVEYTMDTNWPSINDFTSQISKVLALPRMAWREPKYTDPSATRVMHRDGFRVVARTAKGEPPIIALVDTKAEKLVKERRTAIEEKKHQAFKP